MEDSVVTGTDDKGAVETVAVVPDSEARMLDLWRCAVMVAESVTAGGMLEAAAAAAAVAAAAASKALETLSAWSCCFLCNNSFSVRLLCELGAGPVEHT